MNAFYEAFVQVRKKPGVVPPPPRGLHCHCSTSLCSNSENVAAGKGYDDLSAGLEHPRVADRRWIGTWKASQRGMT